MTGPTPAPRAPIQPLFGEPIAKGQPHLAYEEHVRNPQKGDCTPEETALLCSAIADGRSFREAAAIVGTRSRNACIGRMFRLAAKMDTPTLRPLTAVACPGMGA